MQTPQIIPPAEITQPYPDPSMNEHLNAIMRDILSTHFGVTPIQKAQNLKAQLDEKNDDFQDLDKMCERTNR